MARRKGVQRNAPYVATKALNDFFERIRYVSIPDKIDAGLLLDYNIPKGNVFALISALKFLGLIDDEGKPTLALNSLQVTGEEFTIALQNVIKAAYSDLFSKLDVSRDSREHIRNYFARNYSTAKAGDSTSLFLTLCRQAGIPLSENLSTVRGVSTVKDKTRIVSRRTSSGIRQEQTSQVTEQEMMSDVDIQRLYLRRLIEQVSPPDTAGKDADAIKAEAELRKAELDRIERLLGIIDKNKESTED
jgi:hypothetical protein